MDYLSSNGRTYNIDVPDEGGCFLCNGCEVLCSEEVMRGTETEYYLMRDGGRPFNHLDHLIDSFVIPEFEE